MFIYNSKLGSSNASNDSITVVFPAGFKRNEPVSVYWRRRSDKTSTAYSGSIHTSAKDLGGSGNRLIEFSFGSYAFIGTVTPDSETLSLTATPPPTAANPNPEHFDLAVQHINDAKVDSTIVYTGYLEWPGLKEVMTIVIPYGVVTEGAPFALYYLWAPGSAGEATGGEPVVVRGVFKDVQSEKSSASVTTSYTLEDTPVTYKYDFTFNNKKGQLRVHKNLGSAEGSEATGNFEVA